MGDEATFDAIASPGPNAAQQTAWEATAIGAARKSAEALEYTKNEAAAEEAAAQRWAEFAAADRAEAEAEVTRAESLLLDLVAEIAPAARAEDAARAERDAEQAKVDARVAATAELGEEAVEGGAAATGARAVLANATLALQRVQTENTFHQERLAWAQELWTAPNAALAAADARVTSLTQQVADAQTAYDTAVQTCKVAAFERAAEEYAGRSAATAARQAEEERVRQAYEAEAAIPAQGELGSLCGYPEAVEGEQPPKRPECPEGEEDAPICCGAAQSFLKDGTKLTIETCQLAST